MSAPSAIAAELPVPVPTVPPLPALPSVPVPVPVPVPTIAAPVVVQQLPVVPALVSPVPVAPQPSGGDTSNQSVSRAAPLGSGGRAAPASAARGGSAARPSGARGAGAGSPGRSPSAVAAAASRAPAASRRARHEQRLRRAVRRFRGCLGALPALERRVLILRSGLGARRPSSRARVARVLELSTRRVTRLERRGLRRLRALARRGCGGSAASGGEVSVIRVSAPATSGFGRALLAAATFGGGAPDRIQVKGEQQSSGAAGGGSGAGTTPRLAAPKILPPAAAVAGRGGGASGGPGFALIAGLMLLGVVVAGFVIEVRRAVRPR